ncbi:MAG TPA: response regulator, partial [Actinobacteria bacterium]|nr:response regulator [Actinomycetes bacterium]HEX21196.1 response regulator [Actinomycetota bacterium]
MNILIVDDRKNDRLLLKKILSFHGYKPIEAKNGVEALRILRTSKISLVISDILMPVMDGFRLLRELKKDDNLTMIPFVFYSAHYISDKDKDLA